MAKEPLDVNPFAALWARLESEQPQPTRCRGRVEIGFEDFAARALYDATFAEYVVRSLYAGDVWLLRNAFTHQFMRDTRIKVAQWMRQSPSSFHKMIEGSPDFHRIIDLETGKKYSFRCCKHSAYFYRWNSDPLKLWEPITEKWRIAKWVMGLEQDEYERFTPKDGVVDRIQVVRYPPAIGHLEPHSDPFRHQRLFFSGYMSKRGVDFDGGGFYLVDNNDRAMELEDQIEVGDCSLGYATVYHGVAPCDRPKAPDWNAEDGRWFLSMYSNASDEVPQRHTGQPVKVNIEGVLP